MDWLRGIVVVLVVLVLLLASGGNALAAGGIQVKANATGGGNWLIATVFVGGRAHEVCDGSVRHAGRRAALRGVKTSETGGARWRWRIPQNLAGGVWRVTVRCHRATAPATETARFWTAQPRRVRPGPLVVRGTMDADVWDEAEEGPGSGNATNLYPPGQCTWWAAGERPDLPFFPGPSGNASNWGRSAERAGFDVGPTPRAGDIVVFQPGVLGAGRYGHVAHVEWVDGGRIRISEANFNGRRTGSRRTVKWRGKGLEFIHTRRAASPVVTAPPPNTFRYYIFRTCTYSTTCRTTRRKGPGNRYDPVGILLDGAIVDVACQTVGDRVVGRDASSTNVWDRLADGSYVSDYWVSTVGKRDQFTEPIPRCEGPMASPPSPPVAPALVSPPPSYTVQLTAPPAGKTLTGVEPLSATSDAAQIQFAAYYATNPGVSGSATWHVVGVDSTPSDGFSLSWDTTTVPNQGQPLEDTVRISATPMSASGESAGAQDITRVTVSNPNPDGTYTYHVYGTCQAGTCALNLRSGPGFSSYPKVGERQEGEAVHISCQVKGENVDDGNGNSSDIWDKFSDGTYGSDFYVDTPRIGEFSPPIPQC